MLEAEAAARAAIGHGTVGAVAVDVRGAIAAATSTGGVPGKLFRRVGDSALIGAGTFAHAFGAASATGQGEAIILTALCREAVLALVDAAPQAVAREAIGEMIDATGAEAGIILIDRRGRIGYAHNAASMQVARYDSVGGLQHLWLAPIATARRP
jgi:beta-aspartyl-peptidase (threonine type)